MTLLGRQDLRQKPVIPAEEPGSSRLDPGSTRFTLDRDDNSQTSCVSPGRVIKSIKYVIICGLVYIFSISVYAIPYENFFSQNNSRLNNIIMYKHFDNETLNLYDQQTTNRRSQCEYYKSNAMFYCRNGHSSSYDERENCIIANKQRWCMCMGERNDCFRDRYFYW